MASFNQLLASVKPHRKHHSQKVIWQNTHCRGIHRQPAEFFHSTWCKRFSMRPSVPSLHSQHDNYNFKSDWKYGLQWGLRLLMIFNQNGLSLGF